MLTEHTVAAAAAAAGLMGAAYYRPVTASTNTELLDMADAGAPAWTVLVAGHQEAGRGRLGRRWVSKPGASLLVSVLLRPELDPDRAPLVALAAGVAAVEACAACGVEARCKWPNDVVAADRKLGGILTEGEVGDGRLRHVVVGLGVNVHQRAEDLPEDLRRGATSVAIEGGDPDRGRLLGAYLASLKRLAGSDGPALPGSVLSAYRAVSDTIGREVRAITASGTEVVGTAVGVRDDGGLLVEGAAGVETVTFGEVVHLR